MSSVTSTHTPGLARARRMALVLAGAALFLGVASVIKPSPRSAEAGGYGVQSARSGAQSAPVPQHPKGWKLLGILEGREFAVYCWGAPEGARYSVYTLDGRLIQADLPADEVYRGFPDIDLENLRADPPSDANSPLMLVDDWRD